MAMFSKRPSGTHNSATAGYSVFDAQMSIDGDIETDGTLRVDGRVRGDVKRADVVVVAAGASIVGSVSAREVIIGGTISGNVSALERVELQESGVVTGDIEAAAIMIQEGGKVEGRMSIHPISAGQPKAKSAPSVTPPFRTAFGSDAG